MKRVNANILTQYLRVAIASFLIFLFSGIPSIAADKVFFYHTDATGTPMAMTDSNGDVVWEGDYLPFGEEYEIAGEVKNQNRFIGKEKDEETDLYYFGARYLDARAGRFTATDPVGISESDLANPQRFNRYAYGLNNPYRYEDADGKNARAYYDGLRELVLLGLGYIASLEIGKKLEQIYNDYNGNIYNENTDGADKKNDKKEQSEQKIKGTPGETASGQATDKYGNKIGPSGKPQIDIVKHPSTKRAKDAARQEGKNGPVKHSSPTKGKRHLHPSNKNGEKKPNSTHHEY